MGEWIYPDATTPHFHQVRFWWPWSAARVSCESQLRSGSLLRTTSTSAQTWIRGARSMCRPVQEVAVRCTANTASDRAGGSVTSRVFRESYQFKDAARETLVPGPQRLLNRRTDARPGCWFHARFKEVTHAGI